MPKAKPTPARGAGRTIDWGRDEEYVPLAKLDDIRQAAEAGFCGRCETRYKLGEWVFRDEQGALVGVNCCATQNDTRSASDPIPLGLGDLVDAEEIDGREFVPLSQVMPKNRSKQDMCRKCFQIPAANGRCGCDS